MNDLIGRYEFAASPEIIQRRQRKYVKWFKRGWTVLDVGCGRGLFLELLQVSGINGEGVDIDEEAAKVVKNKGLRYHQSDVKDFLHDKHEFYDGIFCSNFLEHFVPSEVVDFLKLCYGAIKPGGILVLVGPNPRNHQVLTETFWLDPTHVRFYPNKFLEQVLGHLGFKVLEAGDDPETRNCPQTFIKRVMMMILRVILPPVFFEGEEIYLVAKKS